MAPWFDESGRDMRSLDEWEREESAPRTFTRLFLKGFAIAAAIGLLLGILWTLVGLWHFHVSPLF